MTAMVTLVLEKLLRRENLPRDEAAALLNHLLDESSREAQIAAVLVALAMKGETAEELVGFAEAMRSHALKVESRDERTIDTAGTGGSRRKTFNVSTAAAIVIASSGVPVAKHGNRAVSSSTGSADVLSTLGVRIDASPQTVQRCLDELGLCFMFAPAHHQATARVARVRRSLGIRTIFNLLGPLTNPAGVRRQIIGVSDEAIQMKIAHSLALLGCEHAWVLHGLDGLDEITLSARTRVVEVHKGAISAFEIDPRDIGFEYRDLGPLRAASPQASAATIRDVLSGDRRDAARELVLINAAAGILVGGQAQSLREGIEVAAEAIDSGHALKKLEAWVALSNEQPVEARTERDPSDARFLGENHRGEKPKAREGQTRATS